MKNLTIELINSDVRQPHLPVRKREGDAAFDVCASEMVIIYPGQRTKIPLGFKIQPPDGYYAEIRERSGHAFKNGLQTIGNVIDPNYRGEVHAIIINHGTEYVRFEAGDRVAQMVVLPYYDGTIIEGKVLENTERGDSGFGSSGTK